MKKIIFAMLLLISFSAFADADPITKVMKGFNCMACHAIDRKIVGPSFKDIASKYNGIPSAEATLIKNVSVGSKGVWGKIPMPPNDAKLERQADVQRIVQYILRNK